MKSGWVDSDAEALVTRGAKSSIDRDLALRLYTTRLLGRLAARLGARHEKRVGR